MTENNYSAQDFKRIDDLSFSEFCLLPSEEKEFWSNYRKTFFLECFFKDSKVSDQTFLPLSNRALNVIHNCGLSLLEISEKTKSDFTKTVKSCGKKTLNEIEQWLIGVGYSFTNTLLPQESPAKIKTKPLLQNKLKTLLLEREILQEQVNKLTKKMLPLRAQIREIAKLEKQLNS